MEVIFRKKQREFFRVLGMVLLVVLFGACGSGLSRFDGTYVFSGRSEFSVVSDTLIVRHEKDRLFSIERRTGFQLLSDDGKLGVRRYEMEHWSAVYDEGLKVLLESARGKVIAADGRELQVGRRKYKRIK